MNQDMHTALPKTITYEDITKMNRKDRRRIGKLNNFKFPSEINMKDTKDKIIAPPSTGASA